MKRNPRAVNRRILERYFAHLAERGNLTGQVAAARNSVWIVRGEHDEIGFHEADRELLAQAPKVELIEVAGAAHFSITDAPGEVAALIAAQLGGGTVTS